MLLASNKTTHLRNPITENCCSKCYRDYKKGGNANVHTSPTQQQNNISPVSNTSPVLPSPTNSLSTPPLSLHTSQEINNINQNKIETVGEGINGEDSNAKKVQKDTTRCFSCKKKVGLLGFKCRCNFIFCSGHRHAGDHNCEFDYKAMQKSQIGSSQSTNRWFQTR